MGLFTRRRPAVAVADGEWLADSSEVLVADGDEMDDDGCAGETALGARFRSGDATLTIWAYPTYAAPDAPGDYQVGYRIEHATSRWAGVLYDCDGDRFFDSPDNAEVDAETDAALMVEFGEDGAPEAVAAYFEWDGTAW
jgi:hypothetical protein